MPSATRKIAETPSMDEVLRRMLDTPPSVHVPRQPVSKPAKLTKAQKEKKPGN